MFRSSLCDTITAQRRTQALSALSSQEATTGMTRIVVLSRRDITHPLSGGAGRYVHEIFRRLTTRYSITVLAQGGPSSKSVEEIDGITYRHFPGALHRMLLPVRYITKFARKTDLLIDNSDVGIPW